MSKVKLPEPNNNETFSPQEYTVLASAAFKKLDFSSVASVAKSKVMLGSVAELGASLDTQVALSLKGINKGLGKIDAVASKLEAQANAIDAAAAASASNAAAEPDDDLVEVPKVPPFDFRGASDALKDGTRDIRMGIQKMMDNITLYVDGMSVIINGMMAVQEMLQTRLDEIHKENVILVKAIYDLKDDTIVFLTKLSIALEKMLSDFAQCNVDAYTMMDTIAANRKMSLSLAIDNISVIHSRITFNTNRIRHATQYTTDYNAAEYRRLVSQMKKEQGSMANFIFSYFPQAIKGSANIYFGGVVKYFQRKNIHKANFDEDASDDKKLEQLAYIDSLAVDSKTDVAEILKSSSLHAVIGLAFGRYIKKKRLMASSFFEKLTM